MKGKLFYKNGNMLDHERATALLEKFKDAFVIPDYEQAILQKSRSKLIWCNLLSVPRTIPTEELQKLPLSPDTKVYYYGERDNEMVETSFAEICAFVDELEPWEEIDSEVFDDTFGWFIAITHEDISLVQGL